MNAGFRPKRRLRNELFSLALVSAVPVALVAVFPLSALRALPVRPAPSADPLCAFVHLSPEEERAALVSARAAWQLDRNATRRLRTDLFADALPTLSPCAVGDFESRFRVDRRATVPYEPDMLPCTHAASAPDKIVPQGDAGATGRTFSREELLKLN